jgi:hypothetical protein
MTFETFKIFFRASDKYNDSSGYKDVTKYSFEPCDHSKTGKIIKWNAQTMSASEYCIEQSTRIRLRAIEKQLQSMVVKQWYYWLQGFVIMNI